MKLLWALASLAILSSSPAAAQAVSYDEAGRAQGEMLTRVSAAADAYAKSIGIGDGYITYCRVKLNMVGDGHPKDGSIPFGINYRDVTRETLTLTISAREAFERSFLTLCLAEAKNTLRSAQPR